MGGRVVGWRGGFLMDQYFTVEQHGAEQEVFTDGGI